MPSLWLSFIALLASPGVTWKSPQRLDGQPPAVRFVAFDGLCALDADGRAWCAQDRSGTTGFVPVPGLPPAENISTSTIGVCVWNDGEPASCVKSSGLYWSPTRADLALTDGPLRDLDQVGRCAVDDRGTVRCTYDGFEPLALGAVRAGMGAGGVAWLDAKGTLRFTKAQVPNAHRPAPTGLRLKRIVDFAVDEMTGCAIDRKKRVQCWGLRTAKREPTAKRPVIRVDGVKGARRIAVSPGSACAVVAGGRVQCWGEPVPMTRALRAEGADDGYGPYDLGVTGVADLRIDSGSLILLTEDGRVLMNGAVKLQTAHLIAELDAPVAHLGGPPGVTCAVSTAGRTTCWGSTLRRDDPAPGRPVVMDFPPALAADGGYMDYGDGLCVLRRGGTLDCWSLPVSGDPKYSVETGFPSDVGPHGITEISGGMCAAGGGEFRCFHGEEKDDQRSWHPEVVATGVKQVTDVCALVDGGVVRCKPGKHGLSGDRRTKDAPVVMPLADLPGAPRAESIYLLHGDTYASTAGQNWRLQPDEAAPPRADTYQGGTGIGPEDHRLSGRGDAGTVGLDGVVFTHRIGIHNWGCGAAGRKVWCWGASDGAYGPWGHSGVWTELPVDPHGRPRALVPLDAPPAR